MAFWRLGSGFSSTSDVEKILDRPDHTLVDLLKEPEFLQELLSPNTKLIEYLCQEDVMEELVGFLSHPVDKEEDAALRKAEQKKELSKRIQQEGLMESGTLQGGGDQELEGDKEGGDRDEDEEQDEADDDDEHDEEIGDEDEDFEDETSIRERYAHLAAEVLSAEIWSIVETFMENEHLLDQLWTVLDCEGQLDITYASYFTKVNEHLLMKKTDEMLNYIKRQDKFVERFVRQIDNPPLMDFLLKVISTDKPENCIGIIEFLQQQGFIMALIKCLGPDVPASIQCAAGDFLKAFVTISANSNNDTNTIGPNELSRELVSKPVCKELLRLMLYGGTGLATGVGVIIEIIRKNNSDYDPIPIGCMTLETHPPGPRDPIYLGTLVEVFAGSISEFQKLLTKKEAKQIETPFGTIEPLGFERFKICELIAELLHCSNMILLNDKEGAEIVKIRDAERIKRRNEYYHDNYNENNNTNSNDNEYHHDFNDEKEDSAMIDKFDGMEIKEGNSPQNAMDTMPSNPSSTTGATASTTTTSNSEQDPNHYDDEADNGLVRLEESNLRQDPVVGDQLKIALYDNGCITTIIQMFFQFPWNNFLHNVVFDIVQQILNGRMHEGFNRFLAIQLFSQAKLTEAICQGHVDCEEYEKKLKTRLGYMGHLTLISEEVVKFTAVYTPESISSIVSEAVQQQEWINYVTTTLVKTREQYNSILGGKRPDGTDYLRNPDAIIPEPPGGLGVDEDDEDDEVVDHDMEAVGHGELMREDVFGEHSGGLSHEDLEGYGSDDPFAKYLLQQMSGVPGGHIGGSSDEDEEDEDVWGSEERNHSMNDSHEKDGELQERIRRIGDNDQVAILDVFKQ